MNDRQTICNDMLSLACKFAVLSLDDNYKLDTKSSSNRKSSKNNRIVKTSQSNVSAVSTAKRGQDKTNNSCGCLGNCANVDILLSCSKNTISICLSNGNVCKARDYFYYKAFLAASSSSSKSRSGNGNNNNDDNNHKNLTPQISVHVRVSHSDHDEKESDYDGANENLRFNRN